MSVSLGVCARSDNTAIHMAKGIIFLANIIVTETMSTTIAKNDHILCEQNG